jgi:hypothetical protein
LNGQVKAANPFQQLKLRKLQSALQTWAKQHHISLTDGKVKSLRTKKAVCPSFHKAGLVTPYDRSTTIGYRQIETEGTKLKIRSMILNSLANITIFGY